MDFNTIKGAIEEAKMEMLIALLDHSQEIEDQNVKETGDKLPNTVEELKQIEQRNLQTTLNFSITNQEEIPSAIDFLKQNLELELTSLPSPSWELFEEAEIDIDTPMQGNEPTQPTINTQGPDPEEELINKC
ncbi:23105_t:CDS:2 [Gigaspora rosea]|nr:23105_t:CDS:2 [Gigaspora rosea]